MRTSRSLEREESDPVRVWWRLLVPGGMRRAAGESSDEAGGWGGWIGVFYAGIWLFYLLEPIGEAWSLRGTWRGDVGIVATVLFAVAYLGHFVTTRQAFGRPHRHRRPATAALLRYAVQAALAGLSTLAVGEPGTATWVFLAVSGLWTFSIPVAFLVGAGLAGLYELLVWQLDTWTQQNGVVFAIALAMAAVTGGIVASRRQRDLSAARRENARLAVEEERNRMARDLHDILGHSLTVITVKAELAGRLMDVAPERARAEVADLERLSRDALADVRRAVEGYREISLPGELARAREALSAAGIQASVPNATDEVPGDLRELFAWVVREGVTNVIRHSEAGHCAITLHADGISVTDDGRGSGPGTAADAAPAPGGRGNGLRGLHERAVAAGARVATRHLEPSGFSLTVTVAGARSGVQSGSLSRSGARGSRADEGSGWSGARST